MNFERASVKISCAIKSLFVIERSGFFIGVLKFTVATLQRAKTFSASRSFRNECVRAALRL